MGSPAEIQVSVSAEEDIAVVSLVNMAVLIETEHGDEFAIFTEAEGVV